MSYVVLVRVHGKLDVSTAPQLARARRPLESRPCELDLAQLAFMDSTGLALLLTHQRRAGRHGGSLRVVPRPPPSYASATSPEPPPSCSPTPTLHTPDSAPAPDTTADPACRLRPLPADSPAPQDRPATPVRRSTSPTTRLP
ncbi:STAS domain-containing protein [Streptomyces sp. V4I8]|uniref:STAS domain-containing protein n=1 Tax=Streptomyces sp. V4I8 TaxID=3156469 RepID=UPI0035172FEE